jgi:pilus assembly protein CpaF
MEARPANIEGRNEVTQRDLVRNALRMRPDRIIVGEVRGAEAFDMLQAMNTGHEGSLTTVHANSPRDALARIENMVLMAGFDLPVRAIREQMASALHLVVQLVRYSDGKRRVSQVSEITGMESGIVTMQDLYRFEQTGVGKDGEIIGEAVPTGITPTFADQFKKAGISIELGLAGMRVR